MHKEGLRKNVILNTLLTSTTIVFPLITFPYVTKTLSSDGMGKVFFIDAFAQYFILFSSLGIPLYGVREIAKIKSDKAACSKLVTELFLINLLLSVSLCFLFFVSHFYINQISGYTSLIGIACLGIVSSTFLIEWFYQGIENFSYITKRSLIIKGLNLIAIFLLVRKAEDYILYYLLLNVLSFINSIINFSNYLRRYYIHSYLNLNLKKHLKALLIIFSINVSISVYTIMDSIILGFITDPINVSYYNVPLKLSKMYWMVVGGVGTVLVPRISNLFVQKDTEGIRRLMTKSLNVTFLLTVPFALFGILFPKEILFIISGDKYIASANALRILSIVPLIIGVCNVLGSQFLMPIGEERRILHATIAGLIISVSLNVLLIPPYKFLGSAIACLAAELTVCIYIVVSASKRIKVLLDANLIALITVTTLVTLIISLLIKSALHNAYLLVICAALFYALIFVLLQYIYFRNTFIFSIINFKKN